MTASQVPAEVIESLAEATLAGAAERRSTWTRPNLLAEAARAIRPLRMRGTAERLALLDRVLDVAIARCVPLDPPEMFTAPTRFRRLDGTSAFGRPDEQASTTNAVLDAEARLLAASRAAGAPVLSGERGVPISVDRLAEDQRTAVAGIATSGRFLDVLVWPAGTAKWLHSSETGGVHRRAPVLLGSVPRIRRMRAVITAAIRQGGGGARYGVAGDDDNAAGRRRGAPVPIHKRAPPGFKGHDLVLLRPGLRARRRRWVRGHPLPRHPCGTLTAAEWQPIRDYVDRT